MTPVLVNQTWVTFHRAFPLGSGCNTFTAALDPVTWIVVDRSQIRYVMVVTRNHMIDLVSARLAAHMANAGVTLENEPAK